MPEDKFEIKSDNKIESNNNITPESDSEGFIDDLNYSPFSEIFNKEDVVNNSKDEDFFEEEKSESLNHQDIFKKYEKQDDDQIFSLKNKSDSIDSEINNSNSNIDSESFTSEEKLEEMLSETEEDRLKRNFTSEYETKSEDKNKTETINLNFKDFLVLPRISGAMSGSSDSNILHGNKISKKITFDEIVDNFEDENEFDSENSKHTHSSIITHKNIDGIITSLEVVCVCGRKTLVKLNYSYDTDLDSEF